jgi:hypothetical protein
MHCRSFAVSARALHMRHLFCASGACLNSRHVMRLAKSIISQISKLKKGTPEFQPQYGVAVMPTGTMKSV